MSEKAQRAAVGGDDSDRFSDVRATLRRIIANYRCIGLTALVYDPSSRKTCTAAEMIESITLFAESIGINLEENSE